MNQNLREFYLDYLNNYLTVNQIAADHGLSNEQAALLIKIGKELHEEYVLIAAAPELLAELINAEWLLSRNPPDEMGENTLSGIRAAIAKAEGQS